MAINLFGFLIASHDREQELKSMNRNRQIKESLRNNKKFQKFSKKLKQKAKSS